MRPNQLGERWKSGGPAMRMVRLLRMEPGILMKVLDAGAYGVIYPMVSTREGAQNQAMGKMRAGLAEQASKGAPS